MIDRSLLLLLLLLFINLILIYLLKLLLISSLTFLCFASIIYGKVDAAGTPKKSNVWFARSK